MKFNVGIDGKSHCFVELPDMDYDGYMTDARAHGKIMSAVYEKYGNCHVQGYCPVEDKAEVE